MGRSKVRIQYRFSTLVTAVLVAFEFYLLHHKVNLMQSGIFAAC